MNKWIFVGALVVLMAQQAVQLNTIDLIRSSPWFQYAFQTPVTSDMITRIASTEFSLIQYTYEVPASAAAFVLTSVATPIVYISQTVLYTLYYSLINIAEVVALQSAIAASDAAVTALQSQITSVSTATSAIGINTASILIQRFKKTNTGVVFGMSSVLSVLCGQPPPPVPTYLSTTFSAVNTSITITSSSAAQLIVNNYIPGMIKILKTAGTVIRNARSQVKGQSSCPGYNEIVVQALIDKLGNFSETISVQINRTNSNTAIIVSIAYNSTELQELMSLIVEAKLTVLRTTGTCSCLVTKVAAGGARGIRKCKDGRASSESGSSKEKTCKARGKRDVTKARSNARRRASDSNSKSAKKKKSVHKKFVRRAAAVAKNGIEIGNQIQTLSEIYWYSQIKEQLKEFRSTYMAYKTAAASTITNIYIEVVDKYNKTWTDITDITSTALETGLTQIVDFANTVLDESDLYPDCRQYADAAMLLAAQFTTEIIKCKREASARLDEINIIAAEIMINVTIQGNAAISEENRCFREYASSFFRLFLNCMQRAPTDVYVTCHNANMAQIKTTINEYLNAAVNITDVADKKFAEIIEATKNCTKSKLAALSTTLTILKAQYELCKNPPTTTTGSTTTRRPINTSVCSVSYQIITSQGVTTICVINNQASYDAATATCSNNGMQILDIGRYPISLFGGSSLFTNIFAPPSFWAKKSPTGSCQQLSSYILIPYIKACSCSATAFYICTS